MTKFGLVILLVLNENSADTPSKALSISQIMELTKEKLRKSYSTTFRHLHTMEELGYFVTHSNKKEGDLYFNNITTDI